MRGWPTARQDVQDAYLTSGGRTSVPVLKCQCCGESPVLKSNLGIKEELDRMLAALAPRNACCPNIECSNHTVPTTAGRPHYQSFGTTKSGSHRYRCKACGRTFAVAVRATLRQRQADKNKEIFLLLMNKSPMRRICEVADIHPATLYQRIDFFYKQCLDFVAERERRLLAGMVIRRLYVAIDRQEYTINWSNQDDRRNVIMRAVGSADDETGYVFGMHLDFDPDVDAGEVERDAADIGDGLISYPFRRYARLWLKSDYVDFVRQRRRAWKRTTPGTRTVADDVEETYAGLESRIDVEADITQNQDTQLPKQGMQVHPEYTLYGHFFYLKQLFSGVEKVRFFLDQESGIRSACIAAFCDEIRARKVDAFYVRINKNLTVNERRQAVARSRADFLRVKSNYPALKDSEVQSMLIKSRLDDMAMIGKWSDRWLLHPFPSMSEPDKAACYLTDYGDYDRDHLANLYGKASLHAIDRFFMQLRRRVSLFERPVQAAARKWHGYSPYNPIVAMKLLAIFRVFYNYVAVGEDRKTPAMRLGLASTQATLDEIIDYVAHS